MKVILKSYYNRGDKGSEAPGAVISVDDAEGARLIEIGAAEAASAAADPAPAKTDDKDKAKA